MPAKLKFHWPLLVLILAVLVLFWPALLHPSYILYPTFSRFSDTMVIHWPKANLMAQSWQAGKALPCWTPLILSGMPLAANQLAMLFYPPAWLFLIFPAELVFNFLFIFHLWVGGVGICFLLRESLDLSPIAALLGSLTFALNGKWLAHAAGGHVSLVGAVGWLPWVLFGTMMLLRTTSLFSRLKWTTMIAVVLALIIATHSLPFIYGIYLVAAITIWHLIFINPHNRPATIKQLWLPWLAIPILTGLLGAIQLLPLLELAQFSNRAFSLSEAAEFALSPAQLLMGLLLPSAEGGHEYIIYGGLIPLLLVPFGLSRRNRWTWFYGLLLIFTVLFALGPYTPVHSLFYHLAPGFGWVRTPARMFFVATIAMAVLVGFAVDRLRHTHWSPAGLRWLTRLIVAFGGAALLIGLGLILGFGQANRATAVLVIIIPLGLGLILLHAWRIVPAQLFVILIGITLFLDLASFDMSMMRFVSPAEALAPGRAAARYLSQKPGLFRVYSPSYSLPAQTAAVEGLFLADGVEPVHLAVYDQYMARAGGYNDPGFSVTIPNFGDGSLETALRYTQPNLKLLGMLNVTYLVAAFPMAWPGLTLEAEMDRAFIYRNQEALPRAWVAHQSLLAEANWLAQLEKLPHLANVVLIDPSTAALQPSAFNPQPSAVAITRYSADRIELETNIVAPGWLVLSEIWYPGWQAAVNGSPQPVEKVNGLLRGVYLDQPGIYQISMEYRPWTVRWGGWISGITGGLVLILILLGFYKSLAAKKAMITQLSTAQP
ncbi:MAG: hypothetical protein JXM69_14620 [Anaerolineae bacterium]|nr:hypothetical protein [Anaerolineae bacterium]